ncbi:MAG: hypothetical protein CML20_06725 [Rheinheimera sp.]|nr:hypothetical protein [Rheinheimera sp.]
MIFYILVSLLIFFMASLSYIATNLTSTSYYSGANLYLTAVTFFILVAVASLRIDSGFDYLNYYYIFTGKYDTQIEPLYSFIQYFSRLTGSFSFHLMIISIISISVKVLFFHKAKVGNVCYAMFIYYLILYLNADMGVIRQGIAIGFIGLASVCFNQTGRSKWRMLLFIVAASFFHVSAIIFIPLFYVLNRVSISSIKVILMYLLISLFFMYLFIYLSESLRGLILLYGQKFSVYAVNEHSAGLTIGVILKSMLLILFYYFIVSNKRSTCLDITFFKLYMVGIILFLVFNCFPIFSARIGNYFKIFEVVLICRMITLSISHVNKILFLTLSIVWAYLQFYQFLSMQLVEKYYIPYKYNNFLYNL